MKDRKKLLVFHQALAPYRVDLWNALNDAFELEVYFMFENLLEQKFDQERLKGLLDFEPKYLNSGITVGVRAFRWGFLKIINTFKPDIVISYEFSQTTISLQLIRSVLAFDYKLFSMCDDSLHIAETCSGIRKKLRDLLVRRLDGMIMVNEDVAKWYKKHYNLSQGLIVFPIISRESNFRGRLEGALSKSNKYLDEFALRNKKVVLFVGRLAPEKGIDRLIEAFNRIKDSNKEAILVIVGAGDQEQDLIRQINISGSQERILLVGRFEGNELAAWYNLGQIFVLPSHYEPFGAVVNEALLSGSWVICSKNAGASALIQDGQNGRTFDPFDIGLLSQYLTEALDDTKTLTGLTQIAPSRMLHSFEWYRKALIKEIM